MTTRSVAHPCVSWTRCFLNASSRLNASSSYSRMLARRHRDATRGKTLSQNSRGSRSATETLRAGCHRVHGGTEPADVRTCGRARRTQARQCTRHVVEACGLELILRCARPRSPSNVRATASLPNALVRSSTSTNAHFHTPSTAGTAMSPTTHAAIYKRLLIVRLYASFLASIRYHTEIADSLDGSGGCMWCVGTAVCRHCGVSALRCVGTAHTPPRSPSRVPHTYSLGSD
jgi:hypothetical protein